jgi:hypothetical protein
MIIKITRLDQTIDGIFGHLVTDGFDCVTLENGSLAIPVGEYPVGIYDSPHAGHPLPILQNVPGRDFIEIHCGNVPEDSKGCILVGLKRVQDTIEQSRMAFDVLFPMIQATVDRKEPVVLTIY